MAASHTKGTYLAARFRRIASRRGKKRAMVAVGHSILIAAWHMITSDTEYSDQGGDYFIERTGKTASPNASSHSSANSAGGST